MTLLRAAIWLATGFFIIMLFLPLVAEMLDRIAVASQANFP